MELGNTLSYRVRSTLLKNDLTAAETQTQVFAYGPGCDYEKSIQEL